MDGMNAAAPDAVSIAPRPSAREMAFVRACVQGVDPAQACALYLADDRDSAHLKPRQVLGRLLDKLRSLARAHGRPEVAALLARDPAAVRGPSRDRLSLDDYRDQQALDFYTEAELADLYQAEFGGGAWRDPARRRERLRVRLLEALQWLGGLSVREPMPQDPVASWLDSGLAMRLDAAGVHLLGDLTRLIRHRGFRWHRAVRGIGPRRAARLVRWLQDHETTLGALPVDALVPDRQIDKTAATPTPRTGIVPLERFVATSATDGSRGSNRAPLNECRINAADDADAVRAWLARWPAGSATWRTYRKEAERFLLWAVVERGKALSSLDEGDCVAYCGFMTEPGSSWTAPRRTQRWSEHWRPFEGPLSQRSLAQAVSIVRAMCEWCVQQGYLHENPWRASPRAAARGGKSVPAQAPLRALSASDLEHWRQWLDSQTPGPAVERLRFIVDFTAMTGLRRSELAAARLCDLRSGARGTGPSTLCLQVRSRRAKARELPLSSGAARALDTWLRSRGLSLEDDVEEADSPLVTSLRSGEALTAMRLYEVVSDAMKRCACELATRQPDAAQSFSAASMHWLRHSCGIETAAGGARVSEVQDLLGHARAETVKIYFVAALTERNARRRKAEVI